MSVVNDNRSLGELFATLSQDTQTLIRQEIRLARVELTEKAGEVSKSLTLLVIGAAVVYAGALAIIASLIMLLARVIPWWVSSLLVGIVVAGIGLIMLQRGRENLKQVDPTPRQTVETLKEDAQWAKREIG